MKKENQGTPFLFRRFYVNILLATVCWFVPTGIVLWVAVDSGQRVLADAIFYIMVVGFVVLLLFLVLLRRYHQKNDDKTN